MSLYHPQDDDRQRVKDASDIVRVVGEFVALKPKGREFVCLCPFHDDRNPSMCVVPAKQIFHCFVCGTGGDVFTFMQKFHGLEFREALERLAQRAGIELTKRRPPPDAAPGAPKGVTKDDILRANDAAQAFFRAILTHPEHGRAARELIERRGISPEMVERFGIGASPDRWDGLVATIDRKGLNAGSFEAAGLLKNRDSGGRYDALRHRLIFPIQDQLGRVVGFGGRRIRDEDDPKYLNSPETPAFRKNTTLYGLAQAARAIQQQRTAVIVEGYTDVVACHQAGVEHVVGTLGTALTTGHATILRRICDTVVLLFDGDEAGQRAADRAVEVLFNESIDIRVATLAGVTDAKDPDELLKRPGGAEIFHKAVAQARDLLAWRFDRLRAALASSGPAAVARAVEEELDRFNRLGMERLTPVRRHQIIRLIAQASGIDERTIQAQVQTGRPGRGGAVGGGGVSDPDPGRGRNDGANASARELVLGCLLCDGDLWRTMTSDQRDRIRTDAFASPVAQLVADAVLLAGEHGTPPALDAVLAELDPEHELAEPAASWAVVLFRTAESRAGQHPERLRRIFDECLQAAGLEDERGIIAEPKPDGQQSGPADADSFARFVERQRALHQKYGRAGTPRLSE